MFRCLFLVWLFKHIWPPAVVWFGVVFLISTWCLFKDKQRFSFYSACFFSFFCFLKFNSKTLKENIRQRLSTFSILLNNVSSFATSSSLAKQNQKKKLQFCLSVCKVTQPNKTETFEKETSNSFWAVNQLC